MFNFSAIFPTTGKPNRQVQIINPIVVKLADGTARHCEPGEIVEVTHKDALGLDPHDVAFLDIVNREPVPFDPAPTRPDPEPMPLRWSELPKCFADWWALNEKFRIARLHKKLIVEHRISIFGTTSQMGDPSGKIGTILGFQLLDAKGMNPHVIKREIRLDDPAVIAQEREMQRAENAAADHLRELSNTHYITLQKLHLACGQCRLDSAEKLTAITQEIRAIGYELFSMRVAALELHPIHIARLYSGSVLFARYAVHADPYVSGTCFAGYDQSGNIRTYLEDDVEAIAGAMIYDATRTAELTPILAEGRKELAKSKKAVAA